MRDSIFFVTRDERLLERGWLLFGGRRIDPRSCRARNAASDCRSPFLGDLVVDGSIPVTCLAMMRTSAGQAVPESFLCW